MQELGDPLRWKEDGREARGLRLADDLRADAIYGLRWLRRSPGFAVAALASLALGIGANVAVFNLLDDVMVRSLPVDRPDELVLFGAVEGASDPSHTFSYRSLQVFREQSHTLAGIAASAPIRVSVERDGQMLPTAAAQVVSGNYYTLLGVPAILGRVLQASDDGAPGTGNVAVLDYAYWQGAFGRDPGIVGHRLILNGEPFTIVGVSVPEFFGTHVGERVDISVPLSMQPLVVADFSTSLVSGLGANDTWLELVGRRRGETSLAAADAEAARIYEQLLPEILANAGPKGKLFGHPRAVLEPGSRGLSELRRRFSRPLSVLMAVVALVLLIACANIANLLLARGASRRHEVTVRVALGAGRARLVRQFLTESLILSIAGGLLGLVLAIATAGPLARRLAAGAPRMIGQDLSAGLLGFTFGLSLLTALVFGALPALGGARVRATGVLGSRGTPAVAGLAGKWTRGALVALQVAISVVVLVGAGLFVRTLINLQDLDLGFDQTHVLSLRLEPAGSNQKHQNGLRLLPRYADLIARVEALPGVVSASMAGATPLSYENQFGVIVTIPGYQPRDGEDMGQRMVQVFPNFLRTMGIPLRAGRDLTSADNDPAALDDPGVRRSAVINETMARRFFGSPTAAIGRVIQTNNNLTIDVVGVAGDTHDRAMREQTDPLLYCTYAQATTGRGQMTLLVRVNGEAPAIARSLRALASELDPAMPLSDVETLGDRVSAATAQERLVALLSTVFGGVALLLAAVGLAGVTAYGVAQRRSEFGVRLALGASPGGLERLVIWETFRLVLLGLGVGLLLAIGAARSIAHLLYGVDPIDILTLVGAAALLIVASVIAAYVPARQAARVDPTRALRQE